MKRYLAVALLICCISTSGYAQSNPIEMLLYPENQIPNNLPGSNEEKSETTNDILRVSKVSKPTLTLFLPSPEKANGTAIVICPGGGYGIIAIDHEGYKVAKKFNEMGIAAFVLKYRLPNKEKQKDPRIAPLQDAQQAVLLVRVNAGKWNINSSKVGIMGFSAGGHLASTAGTHFEHPLVTNDGKLSLRPDFMILIYPVISADPAIWHAGSFKNLLGEQPSAEQLINYSNEKQVNATTPPSFLVHASDDGGVQSENSIVFYQALVKNKVPAEMHIYQNGGHGFGMQNSTTKDEWMERCKNWLGVNGWLKNQ